MEDALLAWFVCVGYLKEFSLGPVQFSAKFMDTFSKSIVGSQYFTLIEITFNTEMHHTNGFQWLDDTC